MRLLLASVILSVFGHHSAEHVVSQKDKAFSKAALTIRAGEDVVFKNDDAVPHNVYSGSQGFAFNLQSQTPGIETKITFNKAGKVEVRCAFHPTMKLTVTVAP